MKQKLKIGDLIQLSEDRWINIWHKDLQGNFVPKASNDHQRYFLVTGFCEIIYAEASICYVEVFCLRLQQKRWIREWDLEALSVEYYLINTLDLTEDCFQIDKASDLR